MLTKNPEIADHRPTLCLMDLWTTIVLTDEAAREMWEPGAAPLANRWEAIEQMTAMDFRTCISVEPVLDPTAALGVIARARQENIPVRVGLASKVGSWPKEAQEAYSKAWFDWRGEVPQWAYRAFARELADRYGGDPGVILKKSIRDRLPATPGEREG
jgi:DNA repair photolyase